MEAFISSCWNNYLLNFRLTDSDIYFSEEYVGLYATSTECPMCLIVENNGKYMLFPFLRRGFFFNGKQYYDFETAYGYGGPVFNTEDEEFKKKSLRMLYQVFADNNYVAGFVRFHPLFSNYEYFDKIGRVLFDRKTIAIDLSLSENEIWMNEIHTKNRNVIKKAEKNGLEFIVDNEYHYYDEFVKLYNSTMDKLHADDFYYFPQEYYLLLKEKIKDSFLGIVKKENEILSAAIFLYHGIYGHYHLSGSKKEYLSLSPNNLMLFKAAMELKKRGVLLFHLGGGRTSEENDSLFCFKSRFSKSLYQFAIGKLIFNPIVYNTLCNSWERDNPEKVEQYGTFLLKYKY